MKPDKKKLFTMLIVTLSAAIVTGSIMMGLFIPIHGEPNDTDYWSEYCAFDISSLPTVEAGEDGFRILQLTDLHYFYPHLTSKTDKLVETLVKENDPDMIVITGDSTIGPANASFTKHLVKLMDGLGKPWAVVYGNHDAEGKADKFRLGEIYSDSEYCLYENGPYNIGGTGNYAVNITQNGSPFYSLIMMDSNMYIEYDGKEEYGCFTPSQVTWYDWLQTGLLANGYEHSMMFFHIPFPEYRDAYAAWEQSGFDPAIGSGDKREEECNATPNPGMFDKILEKGATTHVFVGHDHVNDYIVEYKGVTLGYGVKSSEQYYHDDDKVGGLIIDINADGNVSLTRKFVQV